MFKVVVNSFLFTLLGLLLFALIRRAPVIRSYRDCFLKAYTVINEKHTITRSNYLTEGQICADHKIILVEAAMCEQDVDNSVILSPRERTILNNLGHLTAFGTLTIPELIDSHNNSCHGYNKKVQFDYRSQTWF